MTTTTTAPVDVAAEYLTLDPTDYKLEPNVRSVPEVDEEFVNSIRDHGVVVAVIAYKVDGQLYIRDGQRRYLGAIEAKRQLPSIVFPKDSLDSKDERIQRIIQQLIANTHRKSVTTADTIKAVRQLELEGMSVTRIAGTGLGLDKAHVKAALTVAKSAPTMELAAQANLDLLQLATITEYEDYPELAERLLDTAIENPEQFNHAASRANQEKLRAVAVEARLAELAAKGVTTYAYEQLQAGEVKRLSNFEKDDAAPLDAAAAGVGVVVYANSADNVGEIAVAIDPIAGGYKQTSNSAGSRAQSGPMTAEQKAERRRIVRSNKAWDATIPVRADWLMSFLQRRQFPKDASAFISVTHTRFPYELNKETDRMAHDLLGLEQKHGINANALAELVEANPAKAGVVMLALTLGKLEEGTSRDTWRYTNAANRAYLLQLREWGYPLSPVEQVTIGELTEVPENPGVIDIEEDLDTNDEGDDGGDAA